MRFKGRESGIWKREPICGSIGYAVDPIARRDVRISLDCDRWDCLRCRRKLTKEWMSRIEICLPGSVIYVAQSMLQKNKLSQWIHRHIDRNRQYICAHLNDESLVLSNGKFQNAKPRNKKKFLKEIREMMESGKVTHMSQRRGERKAVPDRRTVPWSFAFIDEKIIDEYRRCQNVYEFGLFILKYRDTGHIYRIYRLCEDLLQRIERREINVVRCNL
jgi:hypothetical protein